MARGRFLDKSAINNYRLNSLPMEADFLFWRMTILADAEGRLQGKSKLINKMAWPLRDFSDRYIEKWLKLLEDAKDDETGLGLIERYEVSGHEFIWLPGFETHQKGMRKDREAPFYRKVNNSKIPPPPTDLMEKTRQMVVESRGQEEEKTKAEIKTDDRKVAGMIKYYEDELGRVLTPTDYEKLVDFADNYQDGWFKKAVDEAKKNDARSPLRYIEKVMENWQEKGKPTEIGEKNQGIKTI